VGLTFGRIHQGRERHHVVASGEEEIVVVPDVAAHPKDPAAHPSLQPRRHLPMRRARHARHCAGVRSGVHCANAYTFVLSLGNPAWPVAYLAVSLLAASATAPTRRTTRSLNAAALPSDTLFMFHATLSGRFELPPPAPARKSRSENRSCHWSWYTVTSLL
jgi:hypothetical protein